MKGFAIIYQMLVSAIVLLLLGAILNVSRHQVFTAGVGLHRLRAQYAAEAGLACALKELSRDPSWTRGFTREPVPGDDEATFTLHFPDSTNDLRGPTHRAFLVITGEARAQTETLEVCVSGGGSWTQGAALLASHALSLRQDVVVDGFKSLTGSGSVPGNVHSNLAVDWEAEGDHQLHVTGLLSAVGTILLNGPAATLQTETNAPYHRIPRVDVPALVSRLAGPTGPPLVGNPVTLGTGTHYYQEPNLVINGDLELHDGARLVVAGNLTINGSVGGNGALVVDGNARLFGDSQIASGPADYVSIICSGHVVLSGFDGTAYLQALADAEPGREDTPRGVEAAELWSDVKTEVTWMNNFFRHYPTPDPVHWADTQVDAHLAVLGQGSNTWGYSSNPTHLAHGPLRNSTHALQGKIAGGGPTQDFLRERFRHLDDLFRASNFTRAGDDGLSSRAGARKYLNDVRDYHPATSGGLIDIVQSAWTTWNRDPSGDYRDWSRADIDRMTREVLPQLIRQVDLIDYDRVGAAQFRGLVYARGGILADGEITVLGSMVAAADERLPPTTFHGVTLRPGEIRLGASSRFTYVQDMFENGATNLVDLGVLEIMSWHLK